MNVFNAQAARWDAGTCGGGLRWQIFTFNKGYNYKNSLSQGGFFLLAARLAAYTGNSTYVDWANKTWDWTHSVGLLDDTYRVFDGTDALLSCSNINHLQFSAAQAPFIHGSAVLSNLVSRPPHCDAWLNCPDQVQPLA